MTRFRTLVPTVLLSGVVFLAFASPGEGKDPKTGKKQKDQSKILFDFSGENPAAKWVTVNDNVMGGRSKGGFSIKGDQLLFTGSTNTNGGGFSSIRSRPKSLGLAGRDGVMIRFKGDGRTYKFGLQMSGSRATYRADFDTKADSKGWQVARIPFDSFAPSWRGMKLSRDRYPLRRDKVESLGVMIYDKKDGPFRLEVDWIKTYSEK
jgi:NADH dehydrogenase [ubiquinone] 1 alpha subcomplex assembly factor 1